MCIHKCRCALRASRVAAAYCSFRRSDEVRALSSLAVIEFNVEDDFLRAVDATVAALRSSFGLSRASPSHEIAVTVDNPGLFSVGIQVPVQTGIQATSQHPCNQCGSRLPINAASA